jgi:hypothetical protein
LTTTGAHLGDAGIEAFGAGADLRIQVAGEDRRHLIGRAQDDQVTIAGRGIDVCAVTRCWPICGSVFYQFVRRRRRGRSVWFHKSDSPFLRPYDRGYHS